MDDQKYLSDAKYKQFIVAIDKSLKNFEYSSEWADLISCLGKLNKVIQTYSQYPAIPRKLLIGKRLAQCLHPALPSGVHLKALETYGYIFTQIGPARLAQDLFIYSIGLFPLLSEASIAVKPVLLDLYENHFLPLKKKLYPGLSGVLLALLPGIEEVSEFTERTTAIVSNLCESTDEKVFFSCLWDGVLHSSQVRLSALTFVMGWMAKKPVDGKQEVIGSDVNLMVNAVCACFVDTNVLVQRMTLDLAISFISFHTNTYSRSHLVKLLTYALDVLLRRDMSLNRRIFQWLLNTNSEGNASTILNTSVSMDDPDEETDESVSYFHLYTNELLIASVITLFKDVIEKSQETAKMPKGAYLKNKLNYLKPFRILITLLDKPEIGSAILDEVMIEVFRTLYNHSQFKLKLSETNSIHLADVTAINEELIKYANLLFNSFEPFFMWDYLSKMLQKCNEPADAKKDVDVLVEVDHPTHNEIFTLITYLLDIVSLETATETQAEHWPNLLKQVILEMINNVAVINMDTLLVGICLMSKLLSRLSPNFSESANVELNSSFSTPPASPMHQRIDLINKAEIAEEKKSSTIPECVRLSKRLFSAFVDMRVVKKNHSFLSVFHNFKGTIGKFDYIELCSEGYDKVEVTGDISEEEESNLVSKAFQIFCRYLVQLSCFPVAFSSHPNTSNDAEIAEWLQVLIMCCCNGTSFNTQASALSALLDLADVTFMVQSSHKNSESRGNIIPLITVESLQWIEKSNLYKVLAECLWNRISPKNCQYHQSTVDLFLRLHNCTASSSVCEDVINNALKSLNLYWKELSHWRFSVLWHLSREFYKDDNNKSSRGTRTIDKCMLLMVDNLESRHVKIRECVEHWLKHSIHFGDIGRLLETLLLILLHPSSARISIHYVQLLKLKKQFPDDKGMTEERLNIKNEMDDQSSSDEEEKESEGKPKKGALLNGTSSTVNQDSSAIAADLKSPTKDVGKNKYLKTHPLLIHKLLYTQQYDTAQCLYALNRISMILKSEGRSFICAVARTSMSVCNTPHQTLLRELLIRHRRVLSGKEFYGSLAEAHQLLIRASTAKYLEILLSVCLYYIRSEYHESLDSSDTSNDINGNFAVQAASAQVLTQISYLLLEIATDSGKSFSSYINDLLSRSKIQRISLHCLLSTVYSVSSDYRESSDTGYYSMVDCPNLSEFTSRSTANRSSLDLQLSLLKFIESLIFLESCIGTENVASAHPSNKKSKHRDRSTATTTNVSAYEYVQYKPIVSQPMFISAILSVLNEKRWMHLHNDWIKLVITCLPKFSDDMPMTVVPVVNQICTNLKTLTKLFKDSQDGKCIDSQVELLPDYMLIMLDGLTSFCHYCLIGTSTDASLGTSGTRQSSKLKGEETGTSLFTNIVHAFSSNPMVPLTAADINSKAVSDTREGLLKILPSILTAVLLVWQAWDPESIVTTPQSLVSETPVAIGQPKSVRIAILQLITPIAMNHTVQFLAAIANVWCSYRDLSFNKPTSNLRGKEWLMVVNKRLLPEPNKEQKNILDVVQAIKALSLETITDTTKLVLKQFSSKKEQNHSQSLEFCCAQFLYELLLRATHQESIQIKNSLLTLLKDGLSLNLSPPTLFVLFGILNVYVQRVPIPEERRARRDLQDVAQKFLETLNNVAGSSLEGSAWFRRSLQVVAHVEQTSDLDESFVSSEKSSIPETTSTQGTNLVKNSQFSVPVILIMAEYLAPMLDMLYLSEEKDKIPSVLIYLMYNIFPYLKNHSHQNVAGFRACSALLAAISDYQYTLRAWRKDVYELFLDGEFFQMDLLSFSFWKTIIDHLITYDNTVFKDLMQRISLSQSGAINIFANREQEMEQRAQLLKRLSFIVFCGEFDQYSQYLPDIQERISESIRQLQGPVLHEQVFLCFRVLLTRMSPNQLVSLWPPILTELVLVFVHMEHELSNVGKPKSKFKIGMLESFLGINGYFKDPNKWLRVYLAVCKLLDFLLVLPSDVLPHYQVYKWAFSETPGIFCASFDEDFNDDTPTLSDQNKEDTTSEVKSQSRYAGMAKANDDISKMAQLNAPIAQRKKQTSKDKQKRNHDNSKQENLISIFFPYISRVVKLLRAQNTDGEGWKASIRNPGELIVLQSKIQSIYDLMNFFLGVTGESAACDVDVAKMRQFNMVEVENLIEKDLAESAPNVV